MSTWKDTILAPDQSILRALEVLNTSSKQMALVVDEQERLLGTVTDGDIRRAILRKVSLDQPVSEVMFKDFTSANTDQSEEEILALMQTMELRHIPVLDNNGRLVDLKVLLDMLKRPELPNTAMIMAGGLGSRLMPLTESCPKPMLEVGGRPVLEIIIEGLKHHGLRNVVLSLNYMGGVIEDHFGNGSNFGVDIKYVREEEPLGTAGALSLLDRPAESFLVMNGDLLTRVNYAHLLQFHADQKTMATMCLRELEIKVPYGVAKVERQRLVALEEKPRHQFFVNAGVYVFQPEVLDHVTPGIRLDMPDLLSGLTRDERDVAVFPIHEYWLDIGRHSDLDRARREFTQGDCSGEET